MKNMLIDSHCHLNYPGLIEDQADVVARAKAAGVGAMISISTRENEWSDVLAGAQKYPHVYASIGIHPHEADQHQHISAQQLVALADDPLVVGIGETGLDYFYEHSDRAAQQRLFRIHIDAARQTGLPLIVHTRDAEEDTVRILKEEQEKGDFPILIHCFTGTRQLAEACLQLGAYISISGIVTFKNAEDLRATVRQLPADRILVETDAPFLAPVPRRGKSCEPAFVVHTVRRIAEERGMDFAEFADLTRENSLRLFSRMTDPATGQSVDQTCS